MENLYTADTNLDNGNKELIKAAKRILKNNKCYATIVITLTVIIILKIIIKKPINITFYLI